MSPVSAFYLTKSWSVADPTPPQSVYIDYVTIIEEPTGINYISCSEINDVYSRMIPMGVSMSDTTVAKNQLNNAFRRSYSYAYYNTILEHCSTYASTYVLPEIGNEKDGRFAYRFGFNGQEKDNEVAGFGNTMTAEFWEYDARLGRRWNVDPIIKPWESPYATFSNNPIYFNDPNGANPKPPKGKKIGDEYVWYHKIGGILKDLVTLQFDARKVYVYHKPMKYEGRAATPKAPAPERDATTPAPGGTETSPIETTPESTVPEVPEVPTTPTTPIEPAIVPKPPCTQEQTNENEQVRIGNPVNRVFTRNIQFINNQALYQSAADRAMVTSIGTAAQNRVANATRPAITVTNGNCTITTTEKRRVTTNYTITVSLLTAAPAGTGFNVIMDARFNLIRNQLIGMGVTTVLRGADQYGMNPLNMGGFQNRTVFSVRSTTTTTTVRTTTQSKCIVPCP